jgi:hypothetical protein
VICSDHDQCRFGQAAVAEKLLTIDERYYVIGGRVKDYGAYSDN